MDIMAAESWGYSGSINAQRWAEMAQFFGTRYAVLDDTTWDATPVANERQVSIAGGMGYGHGVADNFTSDSVLALPAPTLTNGLWYLICARRDWAGRVTDFVALPGDGTDSVTPTEPPAEYPALGTEADERKATPGVMDDHPVWWAWVKTSSTDVVLFDLRTYPIGDSIEYIPTWIQEALEAEDIPGQIAAAIAAEPTVVAAAAAAVEDAMDDADIVYGSATKTPLADTEAEGGFVGENGRITDLVVDDAGDLLTEILERWGPRLQPILEELGMLSGAVDSEWFGGGLAGENGRITDLSLDSEGSILDDTFNRWAERLKPKLIEIGITDAVADVVLEAVYAGADFTNWGDSLTASGRITSKLEELTGLNGHNSGVGGETTTTILARAGAWPWLMVPDGGEIPASGSVDVDFVSSYVNGGDTWPLLQGTGVRDTADNYLWGTVAGVRCRLSIRYKDTGVGGATDYPYHGAGDIYQLTRAADGDAVPILTPTPFIPEYGVARARDIGIFWIGQNGPGDDQTFAGFNAIEQWSKVSAGDRFLFMTKPSPVDTGWTDFELQMADRFGRRYCNVRRFLIDEAMTLMGLTPTGQDDIDIAAGRVPESLRKPGDAIHHTNEAQDAIAEFLLYPRMKELEYI